MAASCAAPTLIHTVRRSYYSGISSMIDRRNYRVHVTGAVPLKSCLSNSLQTKLLSFPSSFSGQSTDPHLWKDHRSSFAQTNAVRELVGSVTKAQGFRFAVVVARFNEFITRPLMEGALATFRHYSVEEEDIDVVWVPGVFEIGVAAERLGSSGKYHAIICIGAVIRGDTTHYDAVANSSASGVLSAGLKSGVPCIFGVLTCENMDQAMNRAGGKVGNKGSEAALTAMEMASLFEHHLQSSGLICRSNPSLVYQPPPWLDHIACNKR